MSVVGHGQRPAFDVNCWAHVTELSSLLVEQDATWIGLAISIQDWTNVFAGPARTEGINAMRWRLLRNRIHEKAWKEHQLATLEEELK
jgi:hypothetical protein